jgi:hypothetical protein
MTRLFDLNLGEGHELLLALQNAGLSLEMARRVVDEPEHTRSWVIAFDSPTTLTAEAQASILPWMPVQEYPRDLAKQVKALELELAKPENDHAGLLLPTGISAMFGTQEFMFTKLTDWIADNVRECGNGLPFKSYFTADRLSIYPGSELPDKKSLSVSKLDFATFRKPEDGVVVREVRAAHPDKTWPTAIEGAWFYGLNTPTLLQSDGEIKTECGVLPRTSWAGSVVGSDLVPGFGRDSDDAFVNDNWADNRYHQASVACFRDCSRQTSSNLPTSAQLLVSLSRVAGRFGWRCTYSP